MVETRAFDKIKNATSLLEGKMESCSPFVTDPVELESPLMKQALHFMRDQSAAPQWLLDTKARIEEAHG